MTIIDKKRANEVRRRGRQPKIRGMVGLQRPQAEPGTNEDQEEDSKMVCVAINDDFVLKQDICVMCGAIGKFLREKICLLKICPHFAHFFNSKVISGYLKSLILL